MKIERRQEQQLHTALPQRLPRHWLEVGSSGGTQGDCLVAGADSAYIQIWLRTDIYIRM